MADGERMITVLVGLDRAAGAAPVRVPAATPAGALWGRVAEGVPPAGTAWIVGGRRVLPGHPLAEGDEVRIVTSYT
jgi:hypothetical protein